jgi:hypothetical protein
MADEVEDERGAVDPALFADRLHFVQQAVGDAHRDEGDALAHLGRGKVFRLVSCILADGDGPQRGGSAYINSRPRLAGERNWGAGV